MADRRPDMQAEPGRGGTRESEGRREGAPLEPSQDSRRLVMTRGASQLLFNYLPGRTVDWEDGLAIVRLGAVRLSSVWEAQRTTVLLNEVAQLLARWRAQGGTVDPDLPDFQNEQQRFSVGLPEAIEATVLETAFLCQSCSTLSFPRRRDLARTQDLRNALTCPSCGRRTLRQFGQVFVHGCGELVPVNEWLPGTRLAPDGSLESVSRPLRCPNCGPAGVLVMPARSERVRDMRVICNRCHTTVAERLTARCPRCTRLIAREGRRQGQHGATSGAEQTGDTIVSRIAMRMSRYSANDTYYPQTITMLRLDRPAITAIEDAEQHELRQLLPLGSRPEEAHGTGEAISMMAQMLAQAEALQDETRRQQILARIAALASAPLSPQVNSEEDEAQIIRTETDVVQSIRESLAFRTTVTTRAALEVVRGGGGATALLDDHISALGHQLGLRDLMLVADLPVITATFGYTRRAFTPTYEEISAENLPTQIRGFPSLDRFAVQRLGRPDLFGTIPILAREGEHEGLFLSLEPHRVLGWLERNGISLPLPGERPLTRVLAALEPVDRYYDQIWGCRVRRLVFGLVHSLSHVAMRAASWYSGLERTSLCEYLFLPLLGTVIFDNSTSFRLGGLETLDRDQFGAFLEAMANDAISCVYDSECLDSRGACHGCIHSPEISCRVFNHGLSRAFLMGGHAPWQDIASDESIVGYWLMDESAG